VCTPPPKVRGEDTLAGWRGGGGGKILKGARHSSVLYKCEYFVVRPNSSGGGTSSESGVDMHPLPLASWSKLPSSLNVIKKVAIASLHVLHFLVCEMNHRGEKDRGEKEGVSLASQLELYTTTLLVMLTWSPLCCCVKAGFYILCDKYCQKPVHLLTRHVDL